MAGERHIGNMRYCSNCGDQVNADANFCPSCGYSLAESTKQVEDKEVGQSVAFVLERLFSSLKTCSEKDLKRYPLSANRRPDVIGNIVRHAGNVDYYDVELSIHDMWWHSGTNGKKRKGYEWEKEAERRLEITPASPNFPVEEEWLSAVAIILALGKHRRNYSSPFPLDYLPAWQSISKASRVDRIIRGFTLFGAIANLASGLLPRKLPKKGSKKWEICRRAYAEMEAQVVIQLLDA